MKIYLLIIYIDFIELIVFWCNKWIGNNDKMVYFYLVYMDMNDRFREI